MTQKRLCDFCREQPVDQRYREVTGIEELRAQGGANKIIGRRETGRMCCTLCAHKIRDGIDINQGSLL